MLETQLAPDGWQETSKTNPARPAASAWHGQATDEQLARAAGRGDEAAFEALYERHQPALLSFARHMLGRVHDAEDAVQHTFLAADRAFRAGKVPRAVRAWLYSVARNRCISLLRARREDAGLADRELPATANLAADVEQRDDLRHLLADLRGLPDDQRAALLLAELGDLTHAEVAEVIGVRAAKVKALVFQARETLLAAAGAREIPCRAIREELAVASGAALRKRHLRNHLAQCTGCRAFGEGVRTQRAALAVILPVVPSVALREGVLAGLGTSAGGAAATGAGLLAVKSTAGKLLAIAALGGAAGGSAVAITEYERSAPSARAAAPLAQATPARASGAAAGAVTVALPAVGRPARNGAPPPRARRGHPGGRAGRGGAPPAPGPDAAAGRHERGLADPPGQGADHPGPEGEPPKQLKAEKVKPVTPKAEKGKPPKAEKVKPVKPPKAEKVKPPKPVTPKPVKPPKPVTPKPVKPPKAVTPKPVTLKPKPSQAAAPESAPPAPAPATTVPGKPEKAPKSPKD